MRARQIALHGPTALVCGHYDVQPALEAEWRTDPWVATAVDGYLYGRGCTDDKGPILATILALARLRRAGLLSMNVTFVYEGEEECRSEGFRECITALQSTDSRREWVSNLALILVSNNDWIDETRPCLTYGMRGLVNMQVTVSAPKCATWPTTAGAWVCRPSRQATRATC